MKKILGSFLLALVLLTTQTFALEKFADETVSISQPINQDLYVAGDTLDISTVLGGDFLGAGGTLSLNNEVKQDAFVAGGTLFIRASIGDDLRVAGGNVYILSKTIGGDLIVAGGNVEIPEGVIIKGDLIIMGGNIKLAGNVDGDVEIYGGNVFLNSVIGGAVTLEAEKLTLGTNTQIKGNINYTLPEKNQGLELITQGTKEFTAGSMTRKNLGKEMFTSADTQKIFWGVVAAFAGYHFLFLFVFGIIFFYLFPGYLRKVGTILSHNTRSMGLKGLLIFVLLPIACIFLGITLIGLPFAGLFFAWFLFFILLYELVCVALFSHMIRNRFFSTRNPGTVTILLQLLVITVLSIIFTLINGVDLLAGFFALGAVATYNWKILKDKLV